MDRSNRSSSTRLVRRMLVALALPSLVAAACAGAEPTAVSEAPVSSVPLGEATSPSSTSGASTSTPPTTAALPASSTAATGPPAIVALTSGRGDDGSLEVGVWFTANPFGVGEVRLIIGTDSDDSFPGVGDPILHLDGWVEISDSELSLMEGARIVATKSGGGLDEWLSWTGPGPVVWTYFFGNVPVRAGTVWIALEIDGELVPLGVAGMDLGEGCSYHSAGVTVDGPVPGDIPDFGAACRYPVG